MLDFVLSILKFIKQRPWVQLSISLIAIGSSSFAVPELWEFIYGFIKAIFKKDSWPDPPSADGISYIVGVAFILGGFIIFYAHYTYEVKAAKLFRTTIDPDHNWILWRGDKNVDPHYSFEIQFEASTYKIPVTILSIQVRRLISGCDCWTFNPLLKNLGSGEHLEFLANSVSLKNPVFLGENATTTFLMTKEGKGPSRSFNNPEWLENGELEMVITYRFTNEKKERSRKILLAQINGTYSYIEKLSPPPLLNDALLKKGLKKKVITRQDYKILSSLNERERFLLLHDGEDYFSSHPDLRKYLPLVAHVNHDLLQNGIN